MLFRNTPYLVLLVVAIFQYLPGRAWVPRNEGSPHVTTLETGKSHGRDSFTAFSYRCEVVEKAMKENRWKKRIYKGAVRVHKRVSQKDLLVEFFVITGANTNTVKALISTQLFFLFLKGILKSWMFWLTAIIIRFIHLRLKSVIF